MKEKVLQAFAELGFELEPVENLGYSFDYESFHMLYMPQTGDDDFLSISLPGIYELEKDNPMVFIDLMNRINSTLKYVKAYWSSDSLWLFYERELFGGEDLLAQISRMILHLEAASAFCCNTLEEIKESYRQSETDETSESDNE